MNNGASLVIPRQPLQGLGDASPSRLRSLPAISSAKVNPARVCIKCKFRGQPQRSLAKPSSQTLTGPPATSFKARSRPQAITTRGHASRRAPRIALPTVGHIDRRQSNKLQRERRLQRLLSAVLKERRALVRMRGHTLGKSARGSARPSPRRATLSAHEAQAGRTSPLSEITSGRTRLRQAGVHTFFILR